MSRVFTLQDQTDFALLSGDFNPIHVDPVASRRLIFGQPVVHGINAVLWALSEWSSDLPDGIQLSQLETAFQRPIHLDEVVDCVLRSEPGKAQIQLMQHGQVVTKIRLEFLQTEPPRIQPAESTPLRNSGGSERSPKEVAESGLIDLSGTVEVYLDDRLAEQIYGQNLLRALGKQQVAQVIALTRLVGMEAPGLHSLFSGFKSTYRNSSVANLEFHVVRFDERFRKLSISCCSSLFETTVVAFVRPKPVNQVSFRSVKGSVDPTEFEGVRAVVVGGSRGIGEVLAKVLAAGGAEVLLTFRNGSEEAKSVTEEISSSGAQADSTFCDVLEFGVEFIERLGDFKPTAVFYCATPFIFGATSGEFSYSRFKTFTDYYVDGFYKIFMATHALGATSYFYPSSIAVEEKPSAMTEYYLAKIAGEELCRWLSRTYPTLNLKAARLPRLATDQTVSLLHSESEDAMGLLKEVRGLLGNGK